MHKLNQLSSMLFGIAYYLFNIITRGGYYGCAKVYKEAQEGNKYALGLLDSPLGHLFRNYHFMQDNIDRDRLTANIIKEYGDYEVGGYGNLDADGLDKQQRGLITPVLDLTLAGENKTIMEIGTANGDVLAHYARKFPGNRYVGVDFSVKKARNKWQHLNNIWFYKGYALDMLWNDELHPDIVFSSSCFCLFAPKELANYMLAIGHSGAKTIVLNEPCWGGYKQYNDGHTTSRHVTQSLWYHNYAGYMRQAGFRVNHFDFFHYKPLTSTRPDIHVLVIRGDR